MDSTRVVVPQVAIVMAGMPDDEKHDVALRLQLYGRDFTRYPDPSPGLRALLRDGWMHETTAEAYLRLYQSEAVR